MKYTNREAYNTIIKQVNATNRVRNKYQKNILIKIPSKQSLIATKNFIKKSKDKLHSISSYSSVNVILNVDNY